MLQSFAEAVGGKHRVIGGPFGSKLTQAHYVADGVPVIRGRNMDLGREIAGDFVFVSHEKFAQDLTANTARPGDIIVTQRGTLGQVAIVPDSNYRRYVVSQSQMAVSVNHKVADPDFVYHYLTSSLFLEYIKTSTIQTGVPHINLGILRDAPVLWPDRHQQRAIATVLSALDDKIALNRRMNDTLEASARALFRDWFVDFGPTCAKAEGRPAYLAPDLWSLFPDRLGDDGLPVGWRTGVLGDIIDVSPPEPLKRGVLVPYLDMAALPTSGPNAQPAVLREYASGTRFRNGDTLLARITPCLENGKTAFVQALPENTVGWGSTEFIVLRAIWPVPESVPYLIARDDDFRRHAIQSMTGTSGRQRASADAVTRYPIALPPDDRLWRCLSPALDATFERIARNAQVSQALAKTRDGLLPKLMSGELRVREAEALAA